jgi:hypothetical protein
LNEPRIAPEAAADTREAIRAFIDQRKASMAHADY